MTRGVAAEGLLLTDLRYATPSPAACPACERNKPFFLKTKLEPIKRPLNTASIIPMTWVDNKLVLGSKQCVNAYFET
jgi:hypothetical protein